MKKLLAAGTATLCALGVISNSFAVDNTPVVAKYDVESAYSVTIPSQITFSKANTSVATSVVVTNVLIAADESIKVSMESANGSLKNGDSYIPYSFTLDDTETNIAANTSYRILSAPTKNPSGITKDITFTAGNLDHVTVSGLHADTLTFKVALDDGAPYMQDISSSMKTSIASKTVTQLKDERDDKTYNVAYLADNYWMTSDLAYAPTGANWSTNGIMVADAATYYTWNTAKTVCPQGWKLPSKSDYAKLDQAYSYEQIVGEPFYGNLSYFYSGIFGPENQYGYLWTSDEDPDDSTLGITYMFNYLNVKKYYSHIKENGVPVRCIVAE